MKKFDDGKGVGFLDLLEKQGEIIDWINAHDESEPKICPVHKHPFCSCGAMAPSSIEQELESGLEHIGSYWHWHTKDKRRPVKRIFLPAAKYEEFAKSRPTPEPADSHLVYTFHNIPVFSYSGETIVYCTD